jgi:hypothetical protein
MKFKIISSVASIFVGVLFFSSSVFAQGNYISGTVGTDLSWPNCSSTLTSLGQFGVIGVTDGAGYSSNPCMASEASHYSNVSLYVNTGWDSSSSHVNTKYPYVCSVGNMNCLAYNYGYNAGLYAFNAASANGLHSSTWWLDVETGDTWSTNTTQNRNSLQGEHDALVASGVRNIGIYSTTYQWDSLTGTWLNNWPSWGATTVQTATQAKTYCSGHQFTGGSTWLIQFEGNYLAI